MAPLPIRKLTDKCLNEQRQWLAYSGSVVYFIGSRRGELVKIGFATSLPGRVRALQTGSPVRLEILAAVAGGVELEREYHRRFAASRERGEWFLRSPEIKAEMSRLQGIGPPPPPTPSAVELARRAANILAFCREQKARLRELG